MKLAFLNYHSTFSMFVLKNNKTETVYDRYTQICFREIFEKLNNKGLLPKTTYKLILFKTKRPLENLRWNNYCPFDKKVITNHLKQAQKIAPELISFSIEDTNIGEDSCYEVSLTLDPAYKIVHKYILTWARFLYESCFTLMLLDALRLSKLPEFRFVSIANILNVVTACYPRDRYPHFNTWHGISTGNGNSFLTSKEIRKRLLRIEYLNDLYLPHPQIKQFSQLDKRLEKANFLSFWESDKDFEEFRKETYLECFNILKVDYPYCH